MPLIDQIDLKGFAAKMGARGKIADRKGGDAIAQ
jgi:hypothetical protein